MLIKESKRALPLFSFLIVKKVLWNNSAKQLSRIETGDYIPSLPTFLKIISVLPIDIKDFGVENTPAPNPMRDKLARLISCASDEELALFYKIAEVIVNHKK